MVDNDTGFVVPGNKFWRRGAGPSFQPTHAQSMHTSGYHIYYEPSEINTKYVGTWRGAYMYQFRFAMSSVGSGITGVYVRGWAIERALPSQQIV
jgi:hypothetical protein